MFGAIARLKAAESAPIISPLDGNQINMTKLTQEQLTNLLKMLQQLESEISHNLVQIDEHSDNHDISPPMIHARIKRSIQAGSMPFVIGTYAIVKL